MGAWLQTASPWLVPACGSLASSYTTFRALSTTFIQRKPYEGMRYVVVHCPESCP